MGCPIGFDLVAANQPERTAAEEVLGRCLDPGRVVVADKGFAGADFDQAVRYFGCLLVRPDRRDETLRHGSLGAIRQLDRKRLLDHERPAQPRTRHGARTGSLSAALGGGIGLVMADAARAVTVRLNGATGAASLTGAVTANVGSGGLGSNIAGQVANAQISTDVVDTRTIVLGAGQRQRDGHRLGHRRQDPSPCRRPLAQLEIGQPGRHLAAYDRKKTGAIIFGPSS